jgi:hypothetical protein
MDPSRLEQALASKPYLDVDAALSLELDSTLLALLDCRNTKVGDCAADLLVRRCKFEDVADAIVEGRFHTTIGKKRALYVLQRFGKSFHRASEAYALLLGDSNKAVLDGALFGLAFLQDKRAIPLVRAAMKQHDRAKPIYLLFEKAVDALEKEDPFIYSPGFHDAGDVWLLDKEKFGNRIG